MYALVIEEGLLAEDFYHDRHRLIYASMLSLYNESEPVDVLTVTDRLRQTGKLEEAGGRAAVDELTGLVPAAANARRYAQIVRENALLRRLLMATYEIQASVGGHTAAPRELVEQAEKAMLEVARDDRKKDFRSIEDVLHDELDKLHRLSLAGTALTGTPSGFKDLDEITGGFQRGNLIVIAGRPSMGKSALVTNMAENAAVEHNRAVALFSLEMSEAELAQRFVASQARIPGDELRKGRVAEARWPKILKASQRLAAAPLYVDDSSDVGLLEVRAKARRLHTQHPGGLGLIIVDYLQLMLTDSRVESRVTAVGELSRGLKMLARELDVPVVALSQLSRAVEQRNPKIPQLADLRECVTGDTLVVLADGARRPIRELVGSSPQVVALDVDDRLVTARSDRVWRVGRRPVLALRLASGRILRATAEHRVRAGEGWKRLSEIAVGDRVALTRRLPQPADPECWSDDRVVLLGHLIGDGSYLPRQPLRYTTASRENRRAVAAAARREFASRVRAYPGPAGSSWRQLSLSGNGNRWAPAGVRQWLRELGIYGQRSHQKRVPAQAFRLGADQIGLLLRHLWATDGCIHARPASDGRLRRLVYYATSSPGLAADVAALLLRLGIVARVRTVSRRPHRSAHHVVVSGADQQRAFLDRVGAFGPRVAPARQLAAALSGVRANTNVDTLPIETSAEVRRATLAGGITQRAMTTLRGTAHGGSSHFRFAPSRAVLAESAEHLDNAALRGVARSDLYWDRVVAVEPCGEEDVYDLTVPGPACWLADGVVSHNSGAIEQDSDLVMFIYRDEYYDSESERSGEADLILAKHRNGGLGTVTLTFQNQYPKFSNYARDAYG
jgi:replicative DNA helicase